MRVLRLRIIGNIRSLRLASYKRTIMVWVWTVDLLNRLWLSLIDLWENELSAFS